MMITIIIALLVMALISVLVISFATSDEWRMLISEWLIGFAVLTVAPLNSKDGKLLLDWWVGYFDLYDRNREKRECIIGIDTGQEKDRLIVVEMKNNKIIRVEGKERCPKRK